MRARVAAAHRDAGQDQRAGVDLVGIDLGVLVLARDEGAERVGVDGFLGRVGREQNVGLIEAFALGDDIAAVEPLQHDAREHKVRGRRADVDADREHAQLVLLAERAAGRGKENAAALGFVSVMPCLHARPSCRACPRQSTALHTAPRLWMRRDKPGA